MAPKAARTQSPCETDEGISTMHRLLNGLHRPRAGLYTELFFEEGRVHSLGPAWTYRVPIAVERNMPKEKSIPTLSSERRTASSFCFRTSMTLRSSRAALIVHVDSTCGYKAIFSCTDIHKPGLPHSFYFLDHFIIVGVCFRINYHDLVGFRIIVKDFGKTCGKKLCNGGKDHRAYGYAVWSNQNEMM
ncbi:hypothetical protein DVH24_000868 [Malus domestica]|uniref:Uncharacterized protein n=1 Tax=Malus domestica TaxID=3750 RepID=A0A498K2X6_MALDO|nr:hypothetical protein DVH24_000868 [Malus domestica]